MKSSYWLLTTLLLEGCFLFPVVEPTDPYAKYSSDEQKEFISVYQNHLKYYVYQNELSADMESYGFSLDQFYGTLHDPYTRYYTPAQATALNQEHDNPEQKGMLGFSFEILHYEDSLPDTLRVDRVYPASPALSMGLKAGDFLLKANGHSVIGDSAVLYGQWTAGAAGTIVELEVLRGEQLLQLKGTKADLALPTVWVDSVAPGISKIQLSGFVDQTIEKTSSDTAGTWLEFRKALQQTSSDQATMIDLRGNPGGSVYQCLNIADEFIGAGKLLIRYEDRGTSTDTVNVTASAGGLAENRKFVFLADSNSASCSEILLSAIRDQTTFRQVGTRTFGKGIGQGFYDTYLHGYTKITSLRFFNQARFAYHGVGIPPTDTVYGESAQLARALQILSPSLTRARSYSARSFLHKSESAADTSRGGAYLFR